MTSIRTDRDGYRLRRRMRQKKGGKPLSGFAMDIVVRFDDEGAASVQDLNDDRNTMRFRSVDDLVAWLGPEIKRAHDEHFASGSNR